MTTDPLNPVTDDERARHLRRVEQFERLKVTEPDDLLIRFGLACEHLALGNWREAATEARHAIGIKPDYSAAHLLLGRSLYNLRELAEAERVLTEGAAMAERAGDLMPAREMRAVLRRIAAEGEPDQPR